MVKQKMLVIFGAMFLIGFVVVGVLINSNLHSTMRTMQFIEGRYKHGKFIDYDNSIAVESADDLGWFRKKGNWYVRYGKLELEFTKSQLKDENILKMLPKIGLDVRGNLEEGDLKWYWEGVELRELAQ